MLNNTCNKIEQRLTLTSHEFETFETEAVPKNEPDSLSLRTTLGRALNQAEPLSSEELAFARQSLGAMLEAIDLRGYLLENRNRIHPASLPLLFHDLVAAQTSANTALAKKLQNIYWHIQFDDDDSEAHTTPVADPSAPFGPVPERTALPCVVPQPAAPLYLFVHVPKTAGTTFLANVVPQTFRPGEAFVLGGDSLQNGEDLRKLSMLSMEKFKRLKFIGGHFAHRLSRFHGRKVQRLTLLREPVERCWSGYFHAMYHESTTPQWDSFRREKLSFAGFIEHYRVRCFEGIFSPELNDEEDCSRTLGQFSAVGLTEKFPEFLFLLHVRQGWKLVLFANRLVRQEKKGLSLSEEDRAAVRERVSAPGDLSWMFRREFELYKQAAERFEALWNQAVTGDLLVNFRTYKSFLTDYQTACAELSPNHSEVRKINVEFETWLNDVSQSTPAELATL